MNCIIIDDEPLARKGIEKLVNGIPQLQLAGCLESSEAAMSFIRTQRVDLFFLDIQMPGLSGIDFAKLIPLSSLVIFTTAFAEYALDSYEVDAIDYLVKPIKPERFKKAVEKALSYHSLLLSEEKNANLGDVQSDFIYIKSDRRFFKVYFQDILFLEALKDYVIIQTSDQRLITHMNLKTMHQLLPREIFLRVNRSYVINKDNIDSFSNNDVYIQSFQISIGNHYRESFLNELLNK